MFKASLSRQHLKSVFFSHIGDYCTLRVLCYLSDFAMPEIDLLNSQGNHSSKKKLFCILIQINQRRILFSVRPRVAILLASTYFGFTVLMVFSVLVFSVFFKENLKVHSLVYCLLLSAYLF